MMITRVTKSLLFFLTVSLLPGFCVGESAPKDDRTAPIAAEPAPEGIYLSDAELYDKLLGGWIGQMAGVVWGAPTEFRWRGAIIPAEEFPAWQPEMINNGLRQDDLYVEIPFPSS